MVPCGTILCDFHLACDSLNDLVLLLVLAQILSTMLLQLIFEVQGQFCCQIVYSSLEPVDGCMGLRVTV